MSVKIYVAASMVEKELAAYYMEKLTASSRYEIACDWTKTQDTDQTVRRGQKVEASLRDLKGVDECDVFWLLAPKEGGAGCWLEMGYALAKSVPMYVVSGAVDRTIFASLPGIARFAEHDEALQYLLDVVYALEESSAGTWAVLRHR